MAINPHLERRGDVGLLVAVSLLAAALGAAVSVALLALAGSIDPGAVPHWLLLGALGRWIGALLAAVPLMAMHREALRQAFAPARRSLTLLLLGTVLASAAAAFGMPAEHNVLSLALACLPAALLSAWWCMPASAWPLPSPPCCRWAWPMRAASGLGPFAPAQPAAFAGAHLGLRRSARRHRCCWCTCSHATVSASKSAGCWRWVVPGWAWASGCWGATRAAPRSNGSC